jgi:demethylmenaquinone methyltransferase/2-methoxy-6-polyprenyl-1,4-benzoquinol methylase
MTKIEGSNIVGVDISQGMLDFGQIKLNQKNLTSRIRLTQADSEKLPFQDGDFDAVTVSFGVRNFENLLTGLAEMHRVLKPGGPMVVLEFSKPTNPIFSRLYWFYFKNILPLMGKMLSRSTNAYTYLPQSVAAFPEGEEFVQKAKSVGFSHVTYKPLTFGICTMYTCVK